MKLFFLTLYFQFLALPLAALLFAFQWKKKTILHNIGVMNQHTKTKIFSPRFLPNLPIPSPPPIPKSSAFLWRFYKNLTLDFLQLIHGQYLWPIQIRSQDQKKISLLKTQPSLLLAAHFHNWEWMGSWLRTNQDIDLLSAALPLQSKFSQSFLIKLRSLLNNPVLFENIPKQALAHISKGKCFGIIWDQNPRFVPSHNLPTQNLALQNIPTQNPLCQKYPLSPFFGIPVPMKPLPNFLLKNFSSAEPDPSTHPEAIPALTIFFGVLLPQGKFRIFQILSSNSNRIRNPNSIPNPKKLARRYHRILEILIRQYPDFYYGLAHRRFKDSTPYSNF